MSGFWYEIGRMQTAGGAIFQGKAEITFSIGDPSNLFLAKLFPRTTYRVETFRDQTTCVLGYL